jgi:hypothetical protein
MLQSVERLANGKIDGHRGKGERSLERRTIILPRPNQSKKSTPSGYETPDARDSSRKSQVRFEYDYEIGGIVYG